MASYSQAGQQFALPNYDYPLPKGPTMIGGSAAIDLFEHPEYGKQPPAFPGAITPMPVLGQPMRIQSASSPAGTIAGIPTAPQRQGFTTINPTTGQPNMLPYTKGSGGGIFNQIVNDPNRIRSLMGGQSYGMVPLAGADPGAGSGGTSVGGSGAPIDGPGGGLPSADPSQVTGPGGANPTPGPNPLPGVDPSGQLPSYILNQFGQNIAGALRGELPQDVQNLLEQQSAEYGVGSGTQGSQFQGYRGLRNLGLTSLDRMKQAEDLVAGQFTKPAEKTALDLKEKELNDLKARADKAYGLDKQKLEAELRIEKDKFAAQQNEYNRRYSLDKAKADLDALGSKYGGGGGGGFSLSAYDTRQAFFNPSTGTTSYY